MLIGSVAAATAAGCAATGSSEQPNSYCEVGELLQPRFTESLCTKKGVVPMGIARADRNFGVE